MVMDKRATFDIYLIITQSCNFSCIYCSDKANIQRKQRPLNLDILLKKYNPKRIFLSGGEPFTYPHIYELINRVSACAQLVLFTNLSILDPVKLRKNVSPESASIACSFHAAEIEKRFSTVAYIAKCKLLSELGLPYTVNLVLHPTIIQAAPQYVALFESENIELKCSLFFGTYNGIKYPQGYSYTDLQRIRPLIPHAQYDLIMRSLSFDLKTSPCSAGVDTITVMPDGSVYRCFSYTDFEEKKLGTVEDFELLDNPIACKVTSCRCFWQAKRHHLSIKKIWE